MRKEILSLLMSLCLALSVFMTVPVSAGSASDSETSGTASDQTVNAAEQETASVNTDLQEENTETASSGEPASETSLLTSALHGDAALTNGDYRIVSALKEDMVLDVAGASVSDGGRVQLYQNNESDAQIFTVTNLGGGLYTLQNKNSGKVLDVAGGSTEKGAIVWQYSSNGSGAQKFYIGTSTKNGYCSIQNSASNLCVDVTQGSAANGTGIQMYTSNDTAAQQWKFVPVSSDPTYEPASLADGYYRISSSLGKNLVFDIQGASVSDGGNLQVYESNGSAAQVYYVNNLGNGNYELMSCCSGRMIDLYAGSTENGTNADQYWRNNSAAQIFYITKSKESDICTIRSSKNHGKVLDVTNGSAVNGANVQLYDDNGSAAQQWSFTSVSQPQVAFSDGLYTIGLFGTAGKVLDVAGASTAPGGNVQIYESNDTNAQKFYITSLGGGNYSIQNAKSYLMLDVEAGSSADGTNVQQYTGNSSNAQIWKITGCPGRYSIVSALGKNLEAAGTSNMANVRINSGNGSDTQNFWLQSTGLNASEKSTIPLDGGIYLISTALNPTKVITVPNGNYAEGITMEINANTVSDAQKFLLTKTDDGYFIIMNVKTGLVLTAKAYGSSSWDAPSNGQTVIQYNEIESNTYKNNQKWKISGSGNGSYNIVSYRGNFCLDVVGGNSANGTTLDVYQPNGTDAQSFRFTETSTDLSIRTHDYATASDGKRYWLEGTFWTDPKVSDTDFLAAAIYCEGNDQGLAGEMMIGYSMLNRNSLAMMRYVIYEYGQYEVCRDRVLTQMLTAIASGNTSAYSKLEQCRQAAKKCVNGDSIVLEDSAWVYSTDYTCVELKTGATMTRADFSMYDGFMTPAAFAKHNKTPAGNHVVHYKGHYYYVTGEIWK